MKIAKEIFEKATVRGLADYFLFGLAPEPDKRDYKARMDATYEAFEKTAFQYEPDGASELLSLANDMTCENAYVYLEIGIQAGILLIADIFKNVQTELYGENMDYTSDDQTVQTEIKKALDIIADESEGNERIKQAYGILKNLEKPGTKQEDV